jgi:hypothetical protein
MQGFHKVSWKIVFTFENYAQQPTQGISALRAPFLPRSQPLPGTRGNMSHLFTLCRGVPFQKISKPCCTTGRIFPIHTSLVWGPVIDPSHSLPSPHNACPPQLCQEGQTLIFTPHDEVPRGLLQTILDTSTVGTKGSHPCARILARYMAYGN